MTIKAGFLGPASLMRLFRGVFSIIRQDYRKITLSGKHIDLRRLGRYNLPANLNQNLLI
jgi:hypothetical protein